MCCWWGQWRKRERQSWGGVPQSTFISFWTKQHQEKPDHERIHLVLLKDMSCSPEDEPSSTDTLTHIMDQEKRAPPTAPVQEILTELYDVQTRNISTVHTQALTEPPLTCLTPPACAGWGCNCSCIKALRVWTKTVLITPTTCSSPTSPSPPCSSLSPPRLVTAATASFRPRRRRRRRKEKMAFPPLSV